MSTGLYKMNVFDQDSLLWQKADMNTFGMLMSLHSFLIKIRNCTSKNFHFMWINKNID